MDEEYMVDEDTGEVMEPEGEFRERIADLRVEFEDVAARADAVMRKLRDLIEEGAWSAVGYASPGAFVAGEFGGQLKGLDAAMRRDVVRELSSVGMSTRAIAPIVGVSHPTVLSDRGAGGKSLPPRTVTGIDGKTYTRRDVTSGDADASPHPVTGIDGKVYTRPEPPKVEATTTSRPTPSGDFTGSTRRRRQVEESCDDGGMSSSSAPRMSGVRPEGGWPADPIVPAPRVAWLEAASIPLRLLESNAEGAADFAEDIDLATAAEAAEYRARLLAVVASLNETIERIG